MWEDPNNASGGKWSVVLPKSYSVDEMLKLWLGLIISVITGEIGDASELCGAVMSSRPWGTIFTVWNKDAENKLQVDSVKQKLEELFKCQDVKYVPHQAAMKKNMLRTNKDVEHRRPSFKKSQITPETHEVLRELIRQIEETSPQHKVEEAKDITPLEEQKEQEKEIIAEPQQINEEFTEPQNNAEAKNKRRRRKKTKGKRISPSSSEDEAVVETTERHFEMTPEEPPMNSSLSCWSKVGLSLLFGASFVTTVYSIVSSTLM